VAAARARLAVPRILPLPSAKGRKEGAAESAAALGSMMAPLTSSRRWVRALVPAQHGDDTSQSSSLVAARQPATKTNRQEEVTHAAPRVARAGAGVDAARTPKQGLRFFLQLHRGAASSETSGGAEEEAAPPLASACSSDGDSLGHLPSPPRAQRATQELPLPEAHAALLRTLWRDDRRLLASAPPGAVPAAVSASRFPDVSELRSALHSLSARARVGPGKAAARALAAAAVLRQAAGLLVHHGARCAALYLEQSARELPGALAGVAALPALRAAAAEVEAGRQEDHPKHAALRKTLAVVATLTPASRRLGLACLRLGGVPRLAHTPFTLAGL
jgi:hypothetical protein